jgi:hypothetical protein
MFKAEQKPTAKPAGTTARTPRHKTIGGPNSLEGLPTGPSIYDTWNAAKSTQNPAVDASGDSPIDDDYNNFTTSLGPGRRLDSRSRSTFERVYGASFSHVQIHTDGTADSVASRVNARAFTYGEHIGFARGQYRPGSLVGDVLLAHELAHVQQQRDARNDATAPTSSDASIERDADRAAVAAVSSDVGIKSARSRMKTGLRLSRCEKVPGADPLIPIADFITYVEAVEQAYPSDTPEEILTRIRQEYYGGVAFRRLMVNAPSTEVLRGDAGNPSRVLDPRIGNAAYRHLTAKADENATGDNPSPYIVMPDQSQIDVGHLLLGLDSLLHRQTGEPYTKYGIEGIDPASWPADLALASFWTSYHDRAQRPHKTAAVKPKVSDFDIYYKASAPTQDLLGDADSFGTYEQWQTTKGQSLSQVLSAYYLGTSTTAAGVDRRWRTFCAANGLVYTESSSAWDIPAIEAAWLPRINRLCDLFEAGKVKSVALAAPTRGDWPHSKKALERFLTWVKVKLETELASHP